MAPPFRVMSGLVAVAGGQVGGAPVLAELALAALATAANLSCRSATLARREPVPPVRGVHPSTG